MREPAGVEEFLGGNCWMTDSAASYWVEEFAMGRESTKDNVKSGMEADFLPEPSPDTLSQFDRRITNAAEYIAYHLGQIDKKLDRLIALLEAAAKERP